MSGRAIVVTSGKGGVGKTTVTANLGLGLAGQGNKVVLIDGDIGLRNLDLILGVENRVVYNVVDVINDRCQLRQALVKDKRNPDLCLIPAPMNKTLANINIDGLNQWGATRDVVVIGYGASSLDTLVEQAAKTQNRTVKGDPEPEKGSYYRSDHFQFAKQGVPALYLRSGIEYIGRPASYGLRKSAEYRNNDYHKVSDEIKADWNLAGAVKDLQLLSQVIYQISQNPQWPRWRPGNEFLPIRNQSLGKTPR